MPPPLVRNPPNPWQANEIAWDEEGPPVAKLEPIEERAKSILAENDSPDVGFRWSINPYRGCFHGCAYCYARPSHQHLGYGAGTDFERKIVVKVNAVELLRQAFARASWKGEMIALSGNTDCYQPLEAHYRLTRGILETCLEHRNPVGVITKNAGIRRDLDLLARLAREARTRVTMSIAFADDGASRAIEPWASPPSKRFETLRMLADAGVPCGVSLAPVIPGLNESDIPEILERARDAGATHAFTVLLRLPNEVLPVFDERLKEAFPGRHAKVMNAIREMRGGKMYESDWHQRQVGRGERWKVIEKLFDTQVKRLGLEELGMGRDEPSATTFRRPSRQTSLF